jgi:alpha/beta superfamily hydrolase
MARGNRTETAGYLQTTAGALAAQLHTSSTVLQTILIMPPLFEERKCCHPSLTLFGRRLTEGSVLCADPAGSGDAPGAETDASLEGWLAQWCAAAARFRRCHPRVPHLWLGIRTSALLLLRQAAALPAAEQPDAVILWEPVTGPDFLRQLLQRRQVNEMLAYGQARRSRQELERAWQAGEAVDCDGYAVPARLYHDLQQLQPVPWHGPGLILSTGPETRTADTCHQLAPATTRLALRLPPFWNAVGQVDTRPMVDATVQWLQARTPRPATPPPPPTATAPAPLLHPVAPDGQEEQVTIPAADGCLRGVLHTPSRPGRGRIVLLHGWSGDRTGPHRMFVHAARTFCQQGFTCLRFDFRGRGDSDEAPGEGATIAGMTADAHAALAWLRQTAPAGGPLTLLAICSGCKVAISTAAADPEIAGLALWSAESMGSLRHAVTSWRKRRAALLAYLRKLAMRETWRKLLRGEVRTSMVGKSLAPSEIRSPAEARAEDATLQAFRRYRGRVLLVFGGSDPDAPGSSRAYAGYCRAHGLTHTCHTVPHAGHSYYGLAWEQEVLRVTGVWLA